MAAVQDAKAASGLEVNADIRNFITNQANPRGIPTIVFINDVASFLSEKNTTVEVTIGAFTEMLQKYKLMEQSLQRQKVTLKTKMPEITNTLDLVQMLKQKQEDNDEMVASYPLSEIVHARASVNCNGTVCLWLGANVMVEYTYEEAISMLETNFKNAEAKQAETNEDIDHLKDQITTLEVNMARVFNFNVKSRRGADGSGSASADGDKPIDGRAVGLLDGK